MASTNASAVSVQKSSAGTSVASGSTNQNTQRRRSCDTVCSSNSSCFLQKRKPIHPLASSVHTYGTRSTGNIVKQRVLSAKMLKLRSIQSQLNDANYHLVELAKENRALKTLQRRQDKALSNYEGVNADLPRLIKSHEGEIRVLQEKNKALRKNFKEASEQLKIKDEELVHVREQLRHLTDLTKDKHLAEREKLQDQVDELKDRLNKSENEISVLNRKLMLEAKNAKFKLNNETSRFRQSQRDLAQALNEIGRLTSMVEAKGKQAASLNIRKKFPHRQSISMISLGDPKNEIQPTIDEQSEPDLDLKSEGSDLKLEPIRNSSKENIDSKDSLNGILKSPIENIKARLSANLKKYKSNLNEANAKLGTLNLSETDLTDFQQTKSIYTVSSNNARKSRPNSSQRLEKLGLNIQKMADSSNSEEDQQLGDYCSQIVTSVKNCKKVVDRHNESLETAKNATDNIIAKLKETDELNTKLIKNERIEKVDIDIPEKDMNIVNKIWKDEYSFQRSLNKSPSAIRKYDMLTKSFDKNGNVTKSGDTSSNLDRSSNGDRSSNLDRSSNGERSSNFDRSSNGERSNNFDRSSNGDRSYNGDYTKNGNIKKPIEATRNGEFTKSLDSDHQRNPDFIETNDFTKDDFTKIDKNGHRQKNGKLNMNDGIAQKEPEVTLEDKRKLLATLRAIDNGESIEDSISDKKSINDKRINIMNELFGNYK